MPRLSSPPSTISVYESEGMSEGAAVVMLDAAGFAPQADMPREASAAEKRRKKVLRFMMLHLTVDRKCEIYRITIL